MVEATAPTFPKVEDPDYVEPVTVEAFKQRALNITDDDGTADTLINDLIVRVSLLESALMPFATHAMALANMQMCLTAANRHNEPPGGTWLNGINSSQLQANPLIFFLAADALGRAKVEQRMLELFNKVQEAQNALTEKTTHVENKTLAGPIGGPATGQTH